MKPRRREAATSHSSGAPIETPAAIAVRDVMCKDVVTVEPETTLREAADILARGGYGGLPVVAGGQVVGVLSGRDLIDFSASARGRRSFREDVPDWSDRGAWDAEEDGGPHGTFFLDLWRESGEDLVDRFADDAGTDEDVLDQHVVAEVMTRKLVTVGPDTPVAGAADLMLETGVHRLLVVEEGRLLGVVTATDLLRVLARLGPVASSGRNGRLARRAAVPATRPAARPLIGREDQ